MNCPVHGYVTVPINSTGEQIDRAARALADCQGYTEVRAVHRVMAREILKAALATPD
jgi:hypothetical protein